MELERIVQGVSPPLIIVDFVGPTDEPTLVALLAADARDRSVYRADPVEVLAGRSSYTPLPALAEDLAAAVRGLGTAPAALLGDCHAAPLTLAVGERVRSSAGIEIPIVLVEPRWPTREDVVERFQRLHRTISRDEAKLPVELPSDPDALLGLLVGRLGIALRGSLIKDGVEPEEAELVGEALLPRYRGWLGYLLSAVFVARRNDIEHWAVTSSDGEASPSDGPHVAGVRHCRLPVSGREVFSSPVVAETVHNLVNAGQPATSP